MIGTAGGVAKAGYGAGALGISAVEFFVRVYLLKLASDTLGLSPVVAGAILAAGTLWDAVTDPLMGEISDRSRFAAGRRRPWIAAGTLLTAVTFVVLFSPPVLGSTTVRAAWLLVVYLAFTTALTILAVPHAALGGELAGDPKGRNQVFAFRFLFTNIGLLLGVVIPAVAAGKDGDIGSGAVWLAPAVLLGGGIAWRATRGQDRPDRSGLRLSFRNFGRSFVHVVRMRAFRPLLAAYVIGSVALTVNSTIALFFYEHRLGFTEKDVFLAVLLPLALVIALSVGAWVLVAGRIGRRRSAFLGVFALGLTTCVVVPLLGPGDLLGTFFWAVGGGALVGSVFLLDATVADVVDLDEALTGVHREGVYFGVWRMGSKVARAGGLLLTGVLLDLIGFDATASSQSSTTSAGLAWILGPGVGALFIVAAIVWLWVPMDEDLQRRAQHIVRRRRERSELGETGEIRASRASPSPRP